MREFEAGATLIEQGAEGEAAATFFVIRSGTAKVTQLQQGESVTIRDSVTSGDYFGEMALLREEPRQASNGHVAAMSRPYNGHVGRLLWRDGAAPLAVCNGM